MKRMWAIALTGFALLLCMGMPAEAATTCAAVASNIDTLAKANAVADAGGINDPTCTLAVNFPITITDNAQPATFTITVGTLTVNKDIINNNDPAGTINLITTGRDLGTGNITVTNAKIKARTLVNLTCTKALCDITVIGSELIATSTLAFGGAGGELRVNARGDVSITTTTFTGGELVKFTSRDATLTVSCGTGEDGLCKDPNIPPIPAIVAPCFNAQGVFIPNCNITIPTAADLKAICIPVVPTPFCDGGSKEKDFIAKGLITFENLVMTADRHLVISSELGPINGKDSELTIGGATTISVDNCSTVDAPCINLAGATITADGPLNVFIKNGCVAGDINFAGAVLKGSPVKVTACGVVLCSDPVQCVGP